MVTERRSRRVSDLPVSDLVGGMSKQWWLPYQLNPSSTVGSNDETVRR